MRVHYHRGSLGDRRFVKKREKLKEPSRRRPTNEGALSRGSYFRLQPPLYKHIFWRRVWQFSTYNGDSE